MTYANPVYEHKKGIDRYLTSSNKFKNPTPWTSNFRDWHKSLNSFTCESIFHTKPIRTYNSFHLYPFNSLLSIIYVTKNKVKGFFIEQEYFFVLIHRVDECIYNMI